MIIDCMGDLHGFYPQLDGGDLLIVAGDLTARDTILEHEIFGRWIGNQNYTKKIFIGGNHDNKLIDFPPYKFNCDNIEYLCDNGTEFEGLKIWGSPWTPIFKGVNPSCKAFMLKEKELKKKWNKIPNAIDILITHGPPHGKNDEIYNENGKLFHTGSTSLSEWLANANPPPRYHIYGHIHEGFGKKKYFPNVNYQHNTTKSINCSYVNEFYRPVNKPIRIVI